MLIRLFGENFRSLRDPFELSFVAADLPSEGDRGVVSIQPEGTEGEEPLQVLRCLAVFGANASGKTTVLEAGRAIEWLIGQSSMKNEPDKPIPPYEPFILSPETREKPITLGCTIFHAGHLYEYTIRYSTRTVESETLVQLGDPDRLLLIREATGVVGGEWIKSSVQLRALVDSPKPNTPIFSFLAQHGPEEGHPSVRSLATAFLSRVDHRDYASNMSRIVFPDHVAKRMNDDPAFKTWVMSHLIRPADFGINKVNVKKFDLPTSMPEDLRKQFADDGPFYETEFIHHGGDARIELFLESAGTRKVYGFAREWYALAHEQRTILADEFSASLHPTLLDHLVRAVNENSVDRRGQLAFATHDSGLLEGRANERPALRKDQIYFTKKGTDGASNLYSLTTFKDDARSVHNLRKRYLGGRYGAIPRIEELSL